MTRKGKSITLSVSERDKTALEHLALSFDMTWGDRPNISRLVEAIARGRLRIAANHDWGQERIDTLHQALNHLKDEGYTHEALTLAHLLLERSELNYPLRQAIQAWADQPTTPWRLDLDRCIRQQRPFRLVYQDAADLIWQFTVRHARITRHEERQYLDCWCDETEGNQDIADLRHNWSLRLDRIPDEAVISPAPGHWQPELGHTAVEFHLLNRLALGYRTKTGADLDNQWLAEQQQRRVVRRIHNTFWFFREIRRYGADCVLVGPAEVRDRFAQDVLAMAQHYAPISP